MNLNYLSFFLISFIPLIIGYYWYNPNSYIAKWSGEEFKNPQKFSITQIAICFLLSFALVYGYMNLVIHQMGFYEIFFTDIMLGDKEAEKIVQDFLGKYGDKYRYFKHGAFHGIINAFVIALPFIGFHAILDKRSIKYVAYHFLYWLITSVIMGGCIAEFV